MELKKGMYVRYKYYYKEKIGKLYDINFSKDLFITDNLVVLTNEDVVKESEILKASNSLMDLIEIGDYVNGYLVDDIEHYDSKTYLNLHFNELEWRPIYIEDIKNIVTKQQFDAEKYVVY